MVNSRLRPVFGTREAAGITRLLFEDLGYEASRIPALDDSDIPGPELEKLLRSIPQLLSGRPVQHILGYAWFYGRRFRVGSQVLIPRPETEELVDLVIRACSLRQPSILDIGTGSGCIAVTLSLEIPDATVSATDISSEALETARQNAADHSARVRFIRDDILHPSALDPAIHFDILVSNPPYVRNSEKELMHARVTGHEPPAALYVDDADPLIYYRAIRNFAVDRLRSGGMLWLEINEALGEETAALYGHPAFKSTRILKDIHGKDRFVNTTKT